MRSGSAVRFKRCDRALVLLALVLLAWTGAAHAQTPPSLVQLVTTLSNNGVFHFDALEFAAAQANDTAWGNIQTQCGMSGQPAAGVAAAPTCSGNVLKLYNRLRELEDTANELLNDGHETQYSLHLSPEGVADAMRWTAPEEYAAQGSMATRFANTQVGLLADRLAALRFASQQIRLAQGDSSPPVYSGWSFAYNGMPLGGSAGADSTGAIASRFSVFVNSAFGSGSKDPTTFEDAFFFDSTEVSIGADMRLTPSTVIGLIAGHSERRVDFNSEASVVDGGIRGNGQGFLAYFQLEGDAAYLNLAAGTQHLSLATRRRIAYPSNNPDIPSVDETSYSNTGSTAWIGTLGAGYTLHAGGFSAEPYINAQYIDTSIKAFTEYDGNGFDTDLPSQSIVSLEADPGLKFEYVLSSRFGVLVPYVYGEYRREFRDSSRDISSSYAATSGQTDFILPTDAAPRHYYVAGGGGSVVIPHGLQGFIQYLRVFDYANYTDHVVSGGIRWEF